MADLLAALDEALVIRPGDLLIIRIAPDRVRSEEEFREFAAQLKEAFEDRLPGSPAPIVVAADQLAVQQP